ncbi:MAG: hypothetical protein ACKO34_01380 [Vampirovibrionales bacterium]
MVFRWVLQWVAYGLGLYALQWVSPVVQVTALVGYVFFATGTWLLERMVLRLVQALVIAVDWLTLGTLSRALQAVGRLLGLALLLMFLPEVKLDATRVWDCWQAMLGLWVYCAVVKLVL